MRIGGRIRLPGSATLRFLAWRHNQKGNLPRCTGHSGNSAMRVSIKGGCDCRTHGAAQDRLPSPAWRRPRRRVAGRPVLRQSEGDGSEDRCQLGRTDRLGGSGAARAGDRGHHSGQLCHRRRVQERQARQDPARPGSVERGQRARSAGACHAGDRCRQPCLPGFGRRRGVEPRRVCRDTGMEAAVGAAGIAALDRDGGAGGVGAGAGGDGHRGERPRRRFLCGGVSRRLAGMC